MDFYLESTSHALGMAIRKENYKIIKLILDAGAEVNISNRFLELAAEHCNFKIFKLLFDRSVSIGPIRLTQIKQSLKSSYNIREMDKIIDFLDEKLTKWEIENDEN